MSSPEGLPGNALPSAEGSPLSSSDSGSAPDMQSFSRQLSEPCLKTEHNPDNGLSFQREGSPVSAEIVLMSQHQMPHSFGEIPEYSTRPLVLHPSVDGEESSMGWLYDFYPGVFSNSKEKLDSYEHGSHELQPSPSELAFIPTSNSPLPPGEQPQLHKIPQDTGQLDFSEEFPGGSTVFKSQEEYEVILGAPTSIAQLTEENTLTYLNKGQFYTLYFRGTTNLPLPAKVKTVLALAFFEEKDKRLEYARWQYWYNQQPNPNQKAFDIDRKSCKNIEIKPGLYHNAACFTWMPKIGAKIVVRVNCLSTEFSSQKGVKGFTLHFVSDTYDAIKNESAEPVHRAFCRVKIFRDKGAERKNKDETKAAEKRRQKMARQKQDQPGGLPVESEVRGSTFHAPSRETVFTSTSTMGPKPFLFIPQQDQVTDNTGMARDQTAAVDFLASIRDRESKRTFGNTLRQTKDELGALEVDNNSDGECEGAPPKKAPRIHSRKVITIYVKKPEDTIYKALLLDSATVHDLKLEVGKKFDAPVEMIKNVYKKTKKGLIVMMDNSMVEQFQNEDDFIIELSFDNQKGSFDLYIHY